MRIQEYSRLPKWTATLLVGIFVSVFLGACETPRKDYSAYKVTGTFTDKTATRSSKKSACNTQVRVGNWAGFGTAYVVETTSTTNRYYSDPNCGLTDCIDTNVRSQGTGRFYFGYDPDQSIGFRTTDVSKRWGFTYPLTYLETASTIPDGTEGIHFRSLGEKNGFKTYLLVSIAHSGLRDLLRTRGHIDSSGDDRKLAVIFQFDKGDPFEQPPHLTPQPVFSSNGVMSMRYGEGQEWVSQTDEQVVHKNKLIDFLLNSAQPSSLLNITLVETTGQVLYVAKLDMRDARKAFVQAYSEYEDILFKRKCAA